MDASAGSRRRRTETMTIQQGISGRRRRGDGGGGGDGVTRGLFKERGDGGVSTRVSSFCSILRAVGFSLWKAQRARLFVAQQLSFTIWGSGPQLYASLLQIPSGASSPVLQP